jgi:zona occludens toxin (predicted ATPase)
MIEVFEGRLGGGKTYSAVSRILVYFAKGGHVFTNISLNIPACKVYCRKHFRVDIKEEQFHPIEMSQVGAIHRHIPRAQGLPVLVVIDEAHLWFNSRDWASTSRELLVYLTQSRKVLVDIIFISQSAQNMDKQFMRLIQYIWRFKDMTKLKIPGIGMQWPLQQILTLMYDHDGHTLMERKFIKRSQDVFDCYDTNALLKPIEFADGFLAQMALEKIKRKTPVEIWRERFMWLNPYVKPALAIFVLLTLIKIKLWVNF